MPKRKVKHSKRRQSARPSHKTLEQCIRFVRLELLTHKKLLKQSKASGWLMCLKSDIACLERILEILEAVKIAKHDAVHNIPRCVGP